MSRLLSAVSLGIAVTAAVAAVAVGVEYTHVHQSPTHLAESASNARVIVKFKQGASVLSTTKSIASATSAGTHGGPQTASVLGGRLGLALTDGRILGERTQVLTATGMTSSALAASIAADADVEWAEVDHRRFVQTAPVNDPLYPGGLTTTTPTSGQWYLRAPGVDASGRNILSSINVEPAWQITHGSAAIVIGDVDTGITQHPDLDSKMQTGYDFIHDGAVANDGDGRDSDPSDTGDAVSAAENSQITNGTKGPFFGCNDNGTGAAVPSDSTWHGTQTAGILGAATNNGAGMAGTAWNSPVIPARALGKCGGYDSDIIAAAQWAAGIVVTGVPANAHPARVINMSLGGAGNCATDTPAYVDALTALRNKGVVVVIAAGNDEGLAVDVPANCQPAPTDADQTPIVVAVAGLRHAGDKVGYSDIGPQITLAAPAGNCVNETITSASPCLYPIMTAINAGQTTPMSGGGTYSDGLNYSAGTSFATPLVAGTVALMFSAAPNLSNAQVISILRSTARPFPTVSDTVPNPAVCTVPTASSPVQDECICTTSTCGAGMLDAGAAVTAAAALSTGLPPSASISPTSPTVVAGSTVTLSGTNSVAGTDGGALTYQWSIPDGDTFVTLGTSTGSTVVVTGVSAGTAQVQLVVTDGHNVTATTNVNVAVTAAGSTGGSGGGGGGGAANPLWLLALVAAGLLLGPRARRTRR